MVGQRVAASPTTARQVERGGLLVGNHSWARRAAHRGLLGRCAVHHPAHQRPAAKRWCPSAAAGATRRTARPTPGSRPPSAAPAASPCCGTSTLATGRAVRRSRSPPGSWAGCARRAETSCSSTTGWGTARLDRRRAARDPRSRCSGVLLRRPRRTRSPRVPRTPVATLSLRPADRAVTEDRDAVAVVRLSGPAGRDTTVQLRVGPGTALSGRDYTRPARSVVIPAGRLSAEVADPGAARRPRRTDRTIHGPVGEAGRGPARWRSPPDRGQGR